MRKLILLILLFAAIGCSENKETKTPEVDGESFLNNLKEAPLAKVSKENLPEWLVTMINDYYEPWQPLCMAVIYKGEWNKETVYFIMSLHSECLCDFFTKDGKRIVENLPDCLTMSKNWVKVYECGDCG